MIKTLGHWRQYAYKCRLFADQCSDPLIRNTMLDIALSYERLAIHADAMQKRQASVAANSDLRGAA